MAGNSADIGIRVFLDDAASQGLYAINSALGQMATTTRTASTAFGGLTGAMAGLGVLAGFVGAFVLFGAAIKSSVDAASAFQQAMFSVAVATHVPLDAAMQYSSTLMNLAASSTYTSTEIADGIVQMGRAGFSIHDIFTQMSQAGAGFVNVGGRMVPIMSSMAQAGIALGIATRSTAVQGFTMLTQAMAAYQAPADQALHFANILQFAFEHQRGTVSELTSALGQVLPVAGQLGVPFREVAAALDVVGPIMKSTSSAGVALRYMLQGLYTPTNPAKDEMIALGLAAVDAGGHFHSAFYDAKGNAVDFDSAVHILSDHLKGLSQEDRMAALKNLFSTKGGQGADILLGNIKELDQYLNQLKQSSDNAGGAMSRWQQVMGTFGGAMSGLRSSITDLATAIGLQLLPFLTQLATMANGVVTAIRNMAMANPGAVSSFLRLGLAMSALGIVATIVVLAIAGIGTGLMMFIGIVAGVAAGVVALTVGIMLVANWFRSLNISAASVHTALAAVGVALLAIGGAIAGIKFAGLVATFVSMAPALAGLVAEFAVFVAESAAYAASVAMDVVVSLALRAALIGAMLPAILDVAVAWLLEGAAMLIANAPIILLIALIAAMAVGLGLLIQHLAQTGQLLAIWRGLWAAIGPVIMQAAAAIQGAFMSAVQQLTPAWNQLVQAFNQARPALMLLGAILGGVIVVALTLVFALVVAGIVVFAQFVVMIIHVVAGIIQAFMGLIQFFIGFFTLLHGLITGNTAEITAGFNTMVQGIVNIFRGLWSAVSAIFIGAFNMIVGFVTTFVNIIIAIFHMLSSVLVGRSIIPDMLNAIRNAFVSILSGIIGWISGWVNSIISFFARMGAQVVAAVTAAWNFVRSVITIALAAVVAVVSSATASVVARFISLGSQVISSVTSAFNQVRAAVSSAMSAVLSAVLSAGASVVSAVTSAFNSARAAAASALAGMVAAVSSGVAAIVSWMVSAGASIISTANNAWNGFKNAVTNGINGAVSLVQGGVSRIIGAISGLPGQLFSWGARAMQSFANGLGSALGAVVDQVKSAAQSVANFLGHLSPAKMGPLANDDEWMPNMMRMMAGGIESNAPLLQNALSKATSGMASVPQMARTGAPLVGGGVAQAAAGGPKIVQLVVNGRILGQAVMDDWTSQLQLNGGGRAFR